MTNQEKYTPSTEDLAKRKASHPNEGTDGALLWGASDEKTGLATAEVAVSVEKDEQGNTVNKPVFVITEPKKDYPVGATFDIQHLVDSRMPVSQLREAESTGSPSHGAEIAGSILKLDGMSEQLSVATPGDLIRTGMPSSAVMQTAINNVREQRNN